MKIVIINGKPQVGKDTFVELCKKHLTWCGNFSTVDFVKEVAKICGWDGAKTPENRKFLSDLKDLLAEWKDIPYTKVTRAITQYENEAIYYGFDTDDVVCFVHCREPQEILRYVKELGAITVLVEREDTGAGTPSNHADAEVDDGDYDYRIRNNGTIKELEKTAIEFLHTIGARRIKE